MAHGSLATSAQQGWIRFKRTQRGSLKIISGSLRLYFVSVQKWAQLSEIFGAQKFLQITHSLVPKLFQHKWALQNCWCIKERIRVQKDSHWHGNKLSCTPWNFLANFECMHMLNTRRRSARIPFQDCQA